jgi:hypothetical protein
MGGVATIKFDALNALLARHESGEEWVAVEYVADDLGESMTLSEEFFDRAEQEELVGRRGIDQDPEYRLTRAGEMLVVSESET